MSNTELSTEKMIDEAMSYLRGISLIDTDNKTLTFTEGESILDIEAYLEDDWGTEGRYLYNQWFENICESGDWSICFANGDDKLTYSNGTLS